MFDNDPVNEIAGEFEEANGLVIGSPVYYASPNGTMISLMDRLMHSTPFFIHLCGFAGYDFQTDAAAFPIEAQDATEYNHVRIQSGGPRQ